MKQNYRGPCSGGIEQLNRALRGSICFPRCNSRYRVKIGEEEVNINYICKTLIPIVMTPTSGEIIRAARQARGYSQEYVALKLGVTQQTYSNLEKRPDGATLGRLRELAKILDVDLMALIGESSALVQNNLNQQGGQAAASMVIHQNSEQKEAYQKMIDHLEEEIDFLRTFLEARGRTV